MTSFSNGESMGSIRAKINNALPTTGTWTVNLRNTSGSFISPTTVTGHYTTFNDTCLCAFHNLDDVDISGATGTDVVCLSLPFACASLDVSFLGGVYLVGDGGTGCPLPRVSNGSQIALLLRENGGTVTFADLTTGSSDISSFTLHYMTA